MNLYDVNGNILSKEYTIPLLPVFAETTLVKHGGGNSASLFTAAYTDGYKAMEGDVRFTSDSIPIMSHDATLGNLTIASSTLAQLQSATNVYTFEQWMVDCKKHNILAEIDFTKTYTNSQCGTLIDIIKASGMIERCTIESYLGSSAEYLAELSDRLALSILGRSTELLIDEMSTIASLIRTPICVIPYANVTASLVEHAHDKGYLVRVWTGKAFGTGVDTVQEVTQYLNMGVDQVITNSVKPSDIAPS